MVATEAMEASALRVRDISKSFPVPEDPAMTPDDRPELRGLKLPQQAIEEISFRNFHRAVGSTSPRPLNKAAAKAAMQQLVERGLEHGYSTETAQLVLKELASC